MCIVRFIGCLHLGHENMARHRGFFNAYEHDENLIYNWNKTVTKRDLTFILGDITMETPKYYYMLDQLLGRKIVVLGNHDRYQDVRELLNHVEAVAGAIDYKGFMLTHIPVHPSDIHLVRGNIHAHIHHNKLEEVNSLSSYNDPGSKPSPSLHKYYHVDAHIINYQPKSLEELLNNKI